MTDPIQSLWIGGELSPMEQLSIASFLAHGHEYHLYSYGEVAASAVIKAPAASEIMAFNWHVCLSCADPARAAWGQLGPKLMARAIGKFGLGAHLQTAEVFCPLAYDEWEELLAPAERGFSEQTHAVHLWNEMWRRGGRDKSAAHDPNCLYESLKREYLMESLVAS